jgi:hypothetical protein
MPSVIILSVVFFYYGNDVECCCAECYGALFRVVCFRKSLIFYSVQGAPLNWFGIKGY